MDPLKKCIFILGPTASGKSSAALRLAQKFKGAIVNVDSLQFFTDLNKGTAKPSPRDFKQVPHYLFNILKMNEVFTAGEFCKQALHLLKTTNESLLFFVGGSGFYFQALEKGMFNLPKADEKVMRELKIQVQNQGLDSLYQELLEKDPGYAKKIGSQDTYRIIRALEVNISQNQKMKDIQDQFKAQPFPYPLLKLGINPGREVLLKKIKTRTEEIINSGLVKEVKELIKLTTNSPWPPLNSVGYKEAQAYLSGDIKSLKELKEEIVKNSMKLAKRQMTWFKRDRETQWFTQNQDLDLLESAIKNFIN